MCGCIYHLMCGCILKVISTSSYFVTFDSTLTLQPHFANVPFGTRKRIQKGNGNLSDVQKFQI